MRAAFTLVELMIVIALVAVAYSIAAPNLTVQTETEIANKLSRLSGDVRSAFDMAVLNRKPYRLVFHLYSGKYWLESTESQNVYLHTTEKESDPSQAQEQEEREEFDTMFAKFEETAGDPVFDQEKDRELAPLSAVLNAKAKLKKPLWTKVESMEWGDRSLGPELIIKDMRAEHHNTQIAIENLEPDEAFGHIYFFPVGYVERAYMHIFYKRGDEVDEEKQPYTLLTLSYQGEAVLNNGYETVDLTTIEEED
ncbi:MAG: type II secretion system protein [Deltaproteobacteria bacterium]|nr:type II secretion system protein [Deltaproteobacteria bacterium]